ncbi:glycosyltransferase family 2 protein [Seonamhaeicola aphaedonensis]|uniref:GT2 family glycosyltransferase n=1 Tax=Seonamhaeicola aphaedonensis TaxID=1461338 RepID=A0A3D9HHP2_9FLAO|nr:glycosyltransferase family 2 protein [Seonamhaeicola aphaedonensis]RED48935.1 GT2 family glycosyltransferase [Seonamhaeicola aphaedonensis]
MKIAVIMACFNRKVKTLECLQNLKELDLPDTIYRLDVYLVDDGSTDGTYDAVKINFPKVNVIKGTGNLFWNGGMRLAWNKASQTEDYDFYLWLNDDVILRKFALKELMDCYLEGLKNEGVLGIVTGAFQNPKNNLAFSYGGRNETGAVKPNGKLQECKYINGNAVLVAKEIFKSLGNLSPDYTHAMGDFDYGLRAINAGFKNYTTRQYIGLCEVNCSPNWANPKVPLKKRLKLFKSPTGLSYPEYIVFRKKFWGTKWILFAIKAYARVLFPSMYKKIKKN